MRTERTFNMLKKVTADWDEIDKLVSDILAADEDGEVDNICISYLSVGEDGVLNENFTPIVSGKEIPSFDLEEKVKFRNIIEWSRNDMLPVSCLFLYSKE